MNMGWPGGDWLRPDWAFGLWEKAAAQAFEALQQGARVAAPDAWPVGPAATIQSIAAAARIGLIGRRVTLRFGATDVRLELTALVVQPDSIGAAFGQFDDVRLSAKEVEWAKGRLKQIVVVARNAHLRLGVALTLVAAPVEIEAIIDQSDLDCWLARRSDHLSVRLGDDGTVRVGLAGRPRLGYLEVEPGVEGDVIRLSPRRYVGFGRGMTGLIRHLPDVRLALPTLPGGLRTTDVEVGPGQLRVRGVIDEWREPLSPQQLLDLARRLRKPGARVDVPRLPAPAPDD
jgi:LmeA-like phospholipid-binding